MHAGINRYIPLGLILLVGCVANEGQPVPLFAPAGGESSGSGYARPAQEPLAPPYNASQDPGNLGGVRETHGVVNRRDCDKLEQTFLKQGRRIQLVDRIRSKNRGATLQWICVFEGEDAMPGYYDRYRR